MTPAQYDSIKQYVGFDAASARALREFFPLAEPHLERIVVDFYDAIEAHPEAMAAITGGQAQVLRLQKTLVRWLHEVLLGPHDEGYLERHSRIGRVHVRIDLPQEFMFTAMNRIRAHLLAVADEAATAEDPKREVKEAVDQVLDLELALMLDTYREDLLDKMRVRERLATLGQLAATIAHELRNPLGTIESSLFLMRRRFDKLELSDETIDKHYHRINEQVQECATTIHSLLDLARDRPLAIRPIDARELLERVTKGVHLPDTFQVSIDAPEGLAFQGDADQLSKALDNLLRNAVQATSRVGSAVLRASRGADALFLDVIDDGPGISAEARGRLFEVLFTTKASGTGLGLPLARKICEVHGGSLDVVPSARGAHFRITLPDRVGMDDS